MSLLLRRRALEALVRDDWEGGGPNDGKYIVCSFISGSGAKMSVQRMVSRDFGQSFSIQALSGSARYATGSTEIPFEVTPTGVHWMGMYSRYGTKYFGSSSISDSYYLKRATFTNEPKAVATNNEGTKLLALYGQYANSVSRITDAGTVETSSLTPISVGNMLGDICADGNLTQVIVGQYSESYNNANISSTPGLDQGFAPCSGSISHDGGLTWTRLQDVVTTDASASNDDGQLYSAAWSNDGKRCAVVYKDKIYGNSLFLSADYGHTFRRVTTFPAGFAPYGVQTSEKFKTIYVNGYGNSSGSILRSKNKGASWTQIRSATTRSTVTCNAAGDKLIACTFGSGQQVVYSHNYGDTWTNAKNGYSNFTRDYVGGKIMTDVKNTAFASYEAMSRDYAAAPTPPKLIYILTDYTCSGTSATAINTGLRLFNTSDFPNGFRIDFRGTATKPTSYYSNVGCWFWCIQEETSPYYGVGVWQDNNSSPVSGAIVETATNGPVSAGETALYGDVGTVVDLTMQYDRYTVTWTINGYSYSKNIGAVNHNYYLTVGGCMNSLTTWFSNRYAYVDISSLKVYKL